MLALLQWGVLATNQGLEQGNSPCSFISVSSLMGGPQERWTAEEGDLTVFDQEPWLSVYHSVSGGSAMGPAL